MRHHVGAYAILEQSRDGLQPKPTCRLPPFSLQKNVENTAREMLLTRQRGNWKSRFAVWDPHTAGRALAENGGALWGGLWLRKKDFSLCIVCLFFCNICWHGKQLFPSMASQCLTQVQAFVYSLRGMASPIICCSLVILGAENGSTNPLTLD